MASFPDHSKGIEELSPTIESVDESITAVNDCLQPLLNCPIADMAVKVSALQRAKVDIISLYAINSMFWVYLKSQGINPATHGLSKELNRVKTYLKRMKELEDKKLAPRIDTSVTKRVMRNALWSAAHKPKQDAADETDAPVVPGGPSAPASAQPATTKARKRTKESKKTSLDGKKKKKKKT